jgi:bifunctional DNA-binding transcriptional regulator/antitoxin component of YhaV-PrlF toxin-antitoxin module
MGRGGLVVTVPKAWAQFYQLKAGDKVEIVANGKLVVRPLRNPKTC